jgi:predicted Zn-dependent peptidase
MGIIRDILLYPAFDAREFDKAKTLQLSELERATESPRQVIGNYFDQLTYGSHVYSNPSTGRSSTVSKMKVEDARKFYSTYYIPNGSAIAIVGNFNKKDMKSRITSLFSPWLKKSVPANNASAPVAKTDAARVLLVNKDDAKETTFIIGGPGVPRNHPDYVAMEVVNTVFGGRFTSWLNDELRVNTGLTYGARSNFTRLKNSGSFGISTFTATKNTEAAIDKSIEVLNRLHEKGIDQETLTSARNYETSGQLSGLLTSMFWYGFDESFINNFQKNVDELNVEKSKAIIAKHFPKNNLQFVLVGKAADIKKIAEKYGKVTVVEIRDEGSGKSF